MDHEDVLTTDGVREIEMNIAARAVLRAIKQLPEAEREIVLLVYGENRLATGRGALAKLK